ncbi:hypothetical protein B0I21_106179 [Sphingobacterium paludis]|uniref:Uncharacterized protein n=1 Tax=Sphingobacterium paludis TaxID=1476465 RepID=A0A4R7CX94_9SPHI|nr:hypothetical protein B0I21_106179 [Sphingobacterium paludis]
MDFSYSFYAAEAFARLTILLKNTDKKVTKHGTHQAIG